MAVLAEAIGRKAQLVVHLAVEGTIYGGFGGNPWPYIEVGKRFDGV
jgi:hypothetical protein